MVKLIVCEDDNIQAQNIKNLINSMKEDFDITIFTSGQALLKQIQEMDDNSIFLLDIVLDEVSGIEIAQTINRILPNSMIVFISAFLEKMTAVYDAEHCYFVYKMEVEERLPKALQKAISIIENAKRTIAITKKDKVVLIHTDDIQYIERMQRTTFFHTKDEIVQSTQDLHYFQKQLPQNFLQCHRSFMVNLDYVKEYERSNFILQTLTLIPISRSHTKKVFEKFQHYLMKKTR